MGTYTLLAYVNRFKLSQEYNSHVLLQKQIIDMKLFSILS